MNIEQFSKWNAWHLKEKHEIKNLGDEWKDQAKFCKQSYEDWKKSLIDTFMFPYIHKQSSVLEIACGHGRWTEFLLKVAKEVFAVDVRQKFLDFCKERFKGATNLNLILKTEKELEINKKIDFVWSYDSFVHFNPEIVFEYIKFFGKCMNKDAIGVIHHANTKVTTGAFGNRAYMTKELFAEMINETSLKIVQQTDEWGTNKQYNCKHCSDFISVFVQTKEI